MHHHTSNGENYFFSRFLAIQSLLLLVFGVIRVKLCASFTTNTNNILIGSPSLVSSSSSIIHRQKKSPRLTTINQTRTTTSSLHVSEFHIPGYAQTKLPFILKEEDLYDPTTGTLTQLKERTYSTQQGQDYISQIPHDTGYLLHKTTQPIFSTEECQSIINEAEYQASQMGWTTNRHGNYPTTDIPIVSLPSTNAFLRKALVERIYPLLRTQFSSFLPLPSLQNLRVADGFIVKYDAEGGQAELKPHRDGSILSFNIALNPASDFDGGGTWFDSLKDAVKIDQGKMVSHASGLLHGGHGITTGKRYIMVAFVILEGYNSFSMRFYNQVRNL